MSPVVAPCERGASATERDVSRRTLGRAVETGLAFARRGIPARGVASLSDTFGRRASRAGRRDALGADGPVSTGLLSARAALLSSLIAALLSTSAEAQEAPEPPAIASGFAPDPLRIEGETRGERPLSSMAPGCRGYVGAEPDQVLQLDSEFAFLRFFVTSEEDVTLAVHGPDDRWRCSGRPLLGAPREQGGFAPGRYEVWIGSVERGAHVHYELTATEFHSVTPASGREGEAMAIGGGAEIGLDVAAAEGRACARDVAQLPNELRLRRGFLPDPRQQRGEAGGEIEVGPIGGGCRGQVQAQPTQALVMCDDLDYFRVQVAEAAGPTSLVVRTPRGEYLCSAPEEGEPAIERDAWPHGTYLIWVGSRVPEAHPNFRLEYTETRPPVQ